MKRNANTTAATATAETVTVAQHTTTERKSAERSTTMRNANTTAAKAAVATKPMTIDAETGWKFTPASIALNGHVFEADKYTVTEKGDVWVLAKVEGVAVRIHVGKASPVYHEALEAAIAYKAKPVEAKPEPVAQEAKPAPAKKPAKAKTAKAKPEPVAQEAKPAPAKKPAKAKAAEPKPTAPAMPTDNAWIGTTIEGKGWRIAFDEATQRTRVILDAEPTAKQRAAIDAAGFYWSNTTKSWNKKLTRKAYRAAQALAETLNAIK